MMEPKDIRHVFDLVKKAINVSPNTIQKKPDIKQSWLSAHNEARQPDTVKHKLLTGNEEISAIWRGTHKDFDFKIKALSSFFKVSDEIFRENTYKDDEIISAFKKGWIEKRGIEFEPSPSSMPPKPTKRGIRPLIKKKIMPTDYPMGGAMHFQSPLYIQRQADKEVATGVDKDGGLVTIQGPSQTGKSSMMSRLCSKIRTSKSQLRAVNVDFQSLPNACFESLSTLWKAVLAQVDTQLGLAALKWRSQVSYDCNLTDYLEKFVFTHDATPVLICLDEVNRVFGMPVHSEFFSSIRYFFNCNAYDPVWEKLRWLLSTSSEPRFFIDDLNQSPFNVGDNVSLGAFTVDQITEFLRRYDFSPDEDEDRVGRIMTYLGGRPYLVHMLLHHMALQPERETALFGATSAGDGIFKDHLNHYLAKFQEQPDLAAAMKCVILGKGCSNVRMADRLLSAGLAKEDEGANIICACELYSIYFGTRL